MFGGVVAFCLIWGCKLGFGLCYGVGELIFYPPVGVLYGLW